MKDDADSKAWAVFGVDESGPKNTLRVVESGRCGLDRIYKHLKDDEVRRRTGGGW